MVQKFKLLIREASADLISNGDASYTLTIILPGNTAERFGILSRKLHLDKAFKLLKMDKFEMQQQGQNSQPQKSSFGFKNDIFTQLCRSFQRHHLQSSLIMMNFIMFSWARSPFPVQENVSNRGASLWFSDGGQISTWTWPSSISHFAKRHWLLPWETGTSVST